MLYDTKDGQHSFRAFIGWQVPVYVKQISSYIILFLF